VSEHFLNGTLQAIFKIVVRMNN